MTPSPTTTTRPSTRRSRSARRASASGPRRRSATSIPLTVEGFCLDAVTASPSQLDPRRLVEDAVAGLTAQQCRTLLTQALVRPMGEAMRAYHVEQRAMAVRRNTPSRAGKIAKGSHPTMQNSTQRLAANGRAQRQHWEAEHRRFSALRVTTGSDVGQAKLLYECSRDDLLSASSHHKSVAATHEGVSTAYRKLAQAMGRQKVATVADLDDKVIARAIKELID